MPIWVSVIISLLSGLLGAIMAIAYNEYTSTPKIQGKICSVAVGDLVNYEQTERYTCFFSLIYITNARKNSVHIFDYDMEVDVGHGFEPVDKPYGIEEVLKNQQVLQVETENYTVEIKDIADQMLKIYEKSIDYGTPQYGILVFGSTKDRSYYEGKVKKYRITLTDVFDHRHTIDVTPGEYPPLYTIANRFGLQLHEKQIIKPQYVIYLTKIAEPATLTRTIITGKSPYYIGEGQTDLVCEKCQNVLAQTIVNGQLRNMVFKCPVCGEYYEQKELPSFETERVIQLTTGTFNFSAPVRCPPDVLIVGGNP